MVERLDFDDDEIVDVNPLARFNPGAIGKEVKCRLKALVDAYSDKKSRTKRFIDWVPPEDLEKFLVLAMEYGCEKTYPKQKKKKRRLKRRKGK